MRVVFLPEVLEYFNELTSILYEKDYFGFEASALFYVDHLIDDIKGTIQLRQHKEAPPYFEQYGKSMKYAAFRSNKQTEWYVFFTVYMFRNELVYLVRHIDNNHMVAHYLVES